MGNAPKLLERVREAIRVRHYSRRTEEAYVYWIRKYIVFHDKKHPSLMGATEISAFLTSLAVRQQVSASTQNQALAGLLFLYKEVLQVEIGSVPAVVRARTPDRLPVVLSTCRTALLGGHQETCDRCGATRLAYHSCGNRHCPKCQTFAKEQWLAARRADLLPIPYFHVVFTLPHALNALAQGNPHVLYTVLFRAAADTLLTFGRDPQHLGGTIGITAILHTWGQNLSQHLHLHCLVTGGALAADGSRWVASRASFLFPVRALSPVFRAKYLAGLQRAFDAGQLAFADGTAALADRRTFTAWLHSLRAIDWVIYAKRPFAGPEQVLEYLGRYTHRVALSNNRLVSLTHGVVRFHWKDYADHDRRQVMALPVHELLRRFLLHILPTGFMRIRHFGLLANRARRTSLARCRHLLGQPRPRGRRRNPSPCSCSGSPGSTSRAVRFCGEGRMQITAIVERPVHVPDTS